MEPKNATAESESRMTGSWYDGMHPHGKPLMSGTLAGLTRTTNMIVKVAAVGVINSAGQILAGFNKKRYVWDIPQGLVENGELVQEAAVRELFEETGLKIELDDLESVALFRNKTPEFVHPWETSIFLAHCGDVRNARNMEPDKCDHLAWFAPVQLPQPRGLSLRVLLNLLGRE